METAELRKLNPNVTDALLHFANAKQWRFPEKHRIKLKHHILINNRLYSDLLINHQRLVMDSPTDGEMTTAAPYACQSDDPAIFTTGIVSVCTSDFTYAIIIIVITMILLVSSFLIIVIIVSSENKKDPIAYYLISLSVTDLLIGVFITPLGIYAAFDRSWGFDTIVSKTKSATALICKLGSYSGVMIWSVHILMFMWITVDRYAYVHKPSRYEVEQTITRCKCWILFTWITATLLCCPTLFTSMEAYDSDTKLCLIDWTIMPAYSATLGVLVVMPAVCSVFYTYKFIFRKLQYIDEEEQEVRTVLETDHHILMVFFVIVVHAISWLPWFALRTYETIFEDIKSPPLHFCLLWLGISQGCWKFIIFMTCNPEFRFGFNNFCQRLMCRCSKNTRQDEYINMQQQNSHYL